MFITFRRIPIYNALRYQLLYTQETTFRKSVKCVSPGIRIKVTEASSMNRSLDIKFSQSETLFGGSRIPVRNGLKE